MGDSPIQCAGTCFPTLTNTEKYEKCHSGGQKAGGAVNSGMFFPQGTRFSTMHNLKAERGDTVPYHVCSTVCFKLLPRWRHSGQVVEQTTPPPVQRPSICQHDGWGSAWSVGHRDCRCFTPQSNSKQREGEREREMPLTSPHYAGGQKPCTHVQSFGFPGTGRM